MGIEWVVSERQTGKTWAMAQRVIELQDEGSPLVVVITHDAAQVRDWFNLLFDAGIDPSRFMICPAAQVDKLRGLRYSLAGIDNVDLIRNPCEVLTIARIGDRVGGDVLLTARDYPGGWCFERPNDNQSESGKSDGPDGIGPGHVPGLLGGLRSWTRLVSRSKGARKRIFPDTQ